MSLARSRNIKSAFWRRGLGQSSSSATYSIPDIADCSNPDGPTYAAQAKSRYGTSDNLQYSDIALLFGTKTVPVTGNTTGWYIGGNTIPQVATGRRRSGGKDYTVCADKDFDLYQNGFTLVTPNGPLNVDRWIYRVTDKASHAGLSAADITAAQTRSSGESAAGLKTTCGNFPDITPAQADNLTKVGLAVPPSTLSCLSNWAGRHVGDGTSNFPGVVTSPGGSLTTPTTPTLPACTEGFVRTADGSNLPCNTGYSLITDISGCQKCQSNCPTGWFPPAEAPTSCPPGETLYTNAASGCQKCAIASNCFVPGSQPPPCPAPLTLESRGNYICCVQSTNPVIPSPQPQYQIDPATGLPVSPYPPQPPTSLPPSSAPTVITPAAPTLAPPGAAVPTTPTGVTTASMFGGTNKTALIVGVSAIGLYALYSFLSKKKKNRPNPVEDMGN